MILAFSNSSFAVDTRELNREHSRLKNTSQKMESVQFSEMLITINQPTRCHIPGESVVHSYRSEKTPFSQVSLVM
jgi:hypothetical protein